MLPSADRPNFDVPATRMRDPARGEGIIGQEVDDAVPVRARENPVGCTLHALHCIGDADTEGAGLQESEVILGVADGERVVA